MPINESAISDQLARVAQCCNLSCETLLFGKIRSFGSILGQPRVHCSGCGYPADQSIHLTTQPLYQGAGEAGKIDQEELLQSAGSQDRFLLQT